MLPRVGKATLLSQTNRAGIAIGAQIGAVLIALTFILPIAIVVWYVRTLMLADTIAADPFEVLGVIGMPFNVGFWRVETTVLLTLALPLLPVAAGRWRPGRAEGLVLVFGYVYYLLLITRAGNRWH
jgi:Ca2+/Na+ antiporter